MTETPRLEQTRLLVSGLLLTPSPWFHHFNGDCILGVRPGHWLPALCLCTTFILTATSVQHHGKPMAERRTLRLVC